VPEFATEAHRQTYILEQQAAAANQAAQGGVRSALRNRGTLARAATTMSRRRRAAVVAQAVANRAGKEEEIAIQKKVKWLVELDAVRCIQGVKMGCTVRMAKEGINNLEKLGLAHEREELEAHLSLIASCHAIAIDCVNRLPQQEYKIHARVVKANKVQIPPETCVIYIRRVLQFLRKGAMDVDANSTAVLYATTSLTT
jgi:hypothetical protein